MNNGWAIIIGAALISVAILISHRYSVSAFPGFPESLATMAGGGHPGAWRIDEWTGHTEFCYGNPAGGGAGCTSVTNYETGRPN